MDGPCFSCGSLLNVTRQLLNLALYFNSGCLINKHSLLNVLQLIYLGAFIFLFSSMPHIEDHTGRLVTRDELTLIQPGACSLMKQKKKHRSLDATFPILQTRIHGKNQQLRYFSINKSQIHTYVQLLYIKSVIQVLMLCPTLV